MDKMLRSEVVAKLRNTEEEKATTMRIEKLRKAKMDGGHGGPADGTNSSVAV
ncbi:hypothetical protein NX059_000530 [Plenodomus lindquistii]|nr:hypothetical protein NX059_000530 [Plenodomus lindquistii]